MESTDRFTDFLETTDWRYSAAVVGLYHYMSINNIKYNKESLGLGIGNTKILEYDRLYFNREDITEDGYLKLVEHWFENDIHALKAISLLELLPENETVSEEQIKLINEKLTANKVMKKYFSKLKFDGTNQKAILDVLNSNKKELVLETFRLKNNLYKNFCNPNLFQKEGQSCCKLNGYYIDILKKGKSTTYNFNSSTYTAKDSIYFDFLPFAFANGRDSIFINDNWSIQGLIRTNQKLRNMIQKMKEKKQKENIDTREVFFEAIINSADFIDHDVEVIMKNEGEDYFTTVMLRKESITILRTIKKFSIFCFSYKVTDKYYINIQKKVTDAIINLITLDDLIEFLLKEESKKRELGRYNFLIHELIRLNFLIRISLLYEDRIKREKRGEGMKKSTYIAKCCAESVVLKFEERKQHNKISSYRTKLTSALVFKDENRFCDILLQLTNYSEVSFPFAFDLFDDFDGNKELAYSFVNALVPSNKKMERKEE